MPTPTNSDDKEPGPIRRWILTYLHCVYLLWLHGERAWPWNVRFVWAYVQRETGLDQKDAS